MRRALRSVAAPATAPSVHPQPSLLAEYVAFPLYDWLVLFYPSWWRPNAVTLCGVAMTLLASLLVLTSLPTHSVFVPGTATLPPAALLLDEGTLARERVRYDVRLRPSVWPFSMRSWSSSSSSTSAAAAAATTHDSTLSSLSWLLSSVLPSPVACMLLCCGVLNLLYCIADNTDGRLARRDRRTSVIGEYLDHGLDCVTSLLSASVVCCVLSASLANMTVAVVLLAYVTVLSHTLHYETNVFVWGNRLVSVDEGMLFFAAAMWLPVVRPQLMLTSLLSPATADALAAYVTRALAVAATHMRSVMHTMTTTMTMTMPSVTHVRAALLRLSVADVLYVFFIASQLCTIADLLRRRPRMLLRGHVLASLLNAAVLLSLVRGHNAHVVTALSSSSSSQQQQQHAHGDAARRALAGSYTLGPLSYPALWTLTCACTSSILVHIPIAARCAHLARTRPRLPLFGLAVVWVLFAYWPAAGTMAAAALHVAQVMYNVHVITRRAAQRGSSGATISNGSRRHDKDKSTRKQRDVTSDKQATTQQQQQQQQHNGNSHKKKKKTKTT